MYWNSFSAANSASSLDSFLDEDTNTTTTTTNNTSSNNDNSSTIDEESAQRRLRLARRAINRLFEYEGLLKRARARDERLLTFLQRPAHLSILLGYAVGLGISLEREIIDDEGGDGDGGGWVLASSSNQDEVIGGRGKEGSEDFSGQVGDEFDERLVKYPFLACELLSLDSPSLLEALVRMGPSALLPFWSFLSPSPSLGPLDPTLAVYFAKIVSSWLVRQPDMVLSFLQTHHPTAIDALIERIEVGPMVEVLYKMLAMPASPHGGRIINFSRWLIEEACLGAKLMARLGPQHSFQVQQSLLQFLGGLFVLPFSLPPPSNLAVDSPLPIHQLLRDLLEPSVLDRFLSDMLCSPYPPLPPSLLHASMAYGVGVDVIGEIVRKAQWLNNSTNIRSGGNGSFLIDLEPLAEAFVARIDVLLCLLEDPPRQEQQPATPLNYQLPSGSVPRVTADRLRTVRLLTILQGLHSPAIDAAFLARGVPRILVGLFFAHPANNLLHGQIVEYIERLLEEECDGGGGGGAMVVMTKDHHRHDSDGPRRKLIRSLFVEARLLEHILAAQRTNEAVLERPFGTRIGHMGHITLIVDCLEEHRGHLEASCLLLLESPEWKEYLARSYGECKLLNARVLGNTPISGPSDPKQQQQQPSSSKSPSPLLSANGKSDGSKNNTSPTSATFASFTAAFPSSADEQIARYFCQQIISNVPPSFAYNLAAELESYSDAEDEEDDDDGEFVEFGEEDMEEELGNGEDEDEGDFKFSCDDEAASDFFKQHDQGSDGGELVEEPVDELARFEKFPHPHERISESGGGEDDKKHINRNKGSSVVSSSTSTSLPSSSQTQGGHHGKHHRKDPAALVIPPGISVPLTLAGGFDNILEMEMRMASLNERSNGFYQDSDSELEDQAKTDTDDDDDEHEHGEKEKEKEEVGDEDEDVKHRHHHHHNRSHKGRWRNRKHGHEEEGSLFGDTGGVLIEFSAEEDEG